ncbi:MAG TPA: diacylglycerol kinase family protein [Gemmatimonadales bacterium]
MRLLALANPRAGRGAGLRRLAHYRSLPSPHAVEWVAATSADDIRTRIHGASERGVEGILVIGGDGTLNDALGPLLESGLPFAVLPAGRGNDFVRNAGLGRGGADRVLSSEQLTVRALDVAMVNQRPYASVAGVGFDGVVTRLANRGGGLVGGTAGYVVSVLRALTAFRPWTVEVVVDEWTWRGDVALVAVANGPCFGGGMMIAPGACMDDGLLDVCIVGAMARGRLLAEFPKIFWGGHTGHPAVQLRRGRAVRVSTAEPEDIYADGEWAGRTPGAWSVERCALNMLVPPGRAISGDAGP